MYNLFLYISFHEFICLLYIFSRINEFEMEILKMNGDVYDRNIHNNEYENDAERF